MYKYTLSLLVGLLFICGCKYGLKTETQFHRELFRQYCDSANKYILIKTECGNALYEYYYAELKKEYALTYPNGNDCCGEEKKFDTVCYPIKK